MSGQIGALLRDSSKVALATWAVSGIEPHLEDCIPQTPEFMRVLIAAVIAGLILEFILQILIGYPRINIEWTERGDHNTLSELAARIRPSNRESQLFTLKVSVATGGWMSEKMIKWLLFRDLEAHIEVHGIMAESMVESSSRTSLNGNSAVLPDSAGTGFKIALGNPPSSAGLWRWADVRWVDGGSLPGSEFGINYSFLHPNAKKALIANTLFSVRSKTKKFRISGG